MDRAVQCTRQRGTETQDLIVECRRLIERMRRIKRREDHRLAIWTRRFDEEYRYRACAQQLPVGVSASATAVDVRSRGPQRL